MTVYMPLERHPFSGLPADDYYCRHCRKPRALHHPPLELTIPSNIDPMTTPIRSPSFSIALRGKKLTDKIIDAYARRGFYSQAFRDARRDFWNRRRKTFQNFDNVQGRLIYLPS